jgi:hypothetical protein
MDVREEIFYRTVATSGKEKRTRSIRDRAVDTMSVESGISDLLSAIRMTLLMHIRLYIPNLPRKEINFRFYRQYF